MLRFLLPLLLTAAAAFAQTPSFDDSGNGQLQGAYAFRHVTWLVGDDAGNLDRAAAVYGTITFDGNGNYTLSGSAYDSDEQRVLPFTRTGTYRLSASGYGYLSNPVVTNARIYGLLSHSIFAGSSTDDELTDLFVASRTGSTGRFEGRYRIAEFSFPSSDITAVRNSTFEWSPDGQGNFGAIQATGFIASRADAITQNLNNIRYSLEGNEGLVTYGGTPGGSALLAGQRLFYPSADGSFVFGGSPAGFDFFVGVRVSNADAPGLLTGLFYQAGADIDASTLSDENYATLHTYYGSVNMNNGTAIGHQRVLTGFDEFAFDYSYTDQLSAGQGNTYDDFLGFRHFSSDDGFVRVGFGQNQTIGLTLSLRAPELAGTRVFLNPTGVVNAASSTPFTAGISRGAFLSLYGTNLSTSTAIDSNFPNTLGGVQVLINGQQAPLYVVSPGLINAVAPFNLTGDIARIEVNNNGQVSNAVTTFINATSPGVFTVPPGGAGYAAAQHTSDFSLVTPENPARPGETIAVYLTGLGDVRPPITAGTPGPTNPLSTTTVQTGTYLDGERATVTFSGLAPTLIGLYQINFVVPNNTPGGDRYLEVSGPDSYHSQALLPVAGAARAAAPKSPRRRGHPENRERKPSRNPDSQ
ncbi:MAG: hypothetical protein JNK87_35560 [Bryobacterales bacterium]|nr:hypothetical protein [Bryobacterales bacterium]